MNIQRGYIVKVGGEEIRIDPDEVEKVLNAIATGNIAMLRQGVLNPSYFSAIVEDKRRRELWLDKIQHQDDYHARRDNGMEPLTDLFEEIRKKLPARVTQAKIGTVKKP